MARAAQSSELFGELSGLAAGVEAARVRQHPDMGAGKRLDLRPDDSLRPIEADAIRAKPHHRDPFRFVPPNFFRQHLQTLAQLVIVELIGAGGRASDKIRDAEFVLGQEADF